MVRRYTFSRGDFYVTPDGPWVTWDDHEAEVRRVREAGSVLADRAPCAVSQKTPRDGPVTCRDLIRNKDNWCMACLARAALEGE